MRLFPFVSRIDTDDDCSADGKTLNQLYIELPTLRAAQTLVRLKNERPLVGRLVAVGLSSLEELIEHVFPAWDAGADGEELIAQEDLDGLLKLCRLEVSLFSPSPSFFALSDYVTDRCADAGRPRFEGTRTSIPQSRNSADQG